MLSFLMPKSASAQAVKTDDIYYLLLGISAVIILVVLVLVIGFAIRYRRGSKAKRGAMPAFFSREFEIGWTSATLILALFLFWWAASSQLSGLVAPKDALEIHVVAKQWMWKTQHPERRKRNQRTACSDRHAGSAGDDLAGCDPLLLRSGVSNEARCGAGPLHRDLVQLPPSLGYSTCFAPSIAAPIIRA